VKKKPLLVTETQEWSSYVIPEEYWVFVQDPLKTEDDVAKVLSSLYLKKGKPVTTHQLLLALFSTHRYRMDIAPDFIGMSTQAKQTAAVEYIKYLPWWEETSDYFLPLLFIDISCAVGCSQTWTSLKENMEETGEQLLRFIQHKEKSPRFLKWFRSISIEVRGKKKVNSLAHCIGIAKDPSNFPMLLIPLLCKSLQMEEFDGFGATEQAFTAMLQHPLEMAFPKGLFLSTLEKLVVSISLWKLFPKATCPVPKLMQFLKETITRGKTVAITDQIPSYFHTLF